jgi:murein DD-endopeptidase MepM/ murein hydrolase activator NlpD
MKTSVKKFLAIAATLVMIAVFAIPLNIVNAARDNSANLQPSYGWNGSAYTGLKAPFALGTTVPITGDPSSHGGGNRHAVDIGLTYQPVLAAVGGKILAYKSYVSGVGMELDIDNGDGYCTAYLHLRSVDGTFQNKGYPVNQGEKFAVSGDGNGLYHPHLHIEVDRINSRGQCNADDSTPEVPMYFDEIPGRELRGILECTGQEAPAERAVGHKGNPELAADGENFSFNVAGPQ